MFCFSLGSFWWSGDFSSSGEVLFFNNKFFILFFLIYFLIYEKFHKKKFEVYPMLNSLEIKSNTCLDLLEYILYISKESYKYFIEFKCSSFLADFFLQPSDCKKFIISNENMYVKEGVTYKSIVKSKTLNDLRLFFISNKFSYAKIKSFQYLGIIGRQSYLAVFTAYKL